MNESKIYKVNLRGFDISQYSGIVTVGFIDHNVAGKATILPGKTKVRVEYMNGVPALMHWIGVGFIARFDGKDPSLHELTVLYGKEPSNYMKRKIRKQFIVPERSSDAK